MQASDLIAPVISSVVCMLALTGTLFILLAIAQGWAWLQKMLQQKREELLLQRWNELTAQRWKAEDEFEAWRQHLWEQEMSA